MKNAWLLPALSALLVACPPAGNKPPTISSFAVSPLSVAACGLVTLSATASDPEGDDLEYVFSAPEGTFYQNGSGRAQWVLSPSRTAATSVTFTVAVSDGTGKASRTASATVAAAASAKECAGGLAGRVQPDYTFLAAPAPAEFVAGEALVGLREGVRLLSGERLPLARTLAPSVGVARLASLSPRQVRSGSAEGRATLEWIEDLRARPEVAWAEPNAILRPLAVPSDPLYGGADGQRQHYELAGLPAAWDAATGASDVIVAVVDTGILWREGDKSRQHPDFACTVGGQPKIVPGYDFVDGDADPYDDDPAAEFHGTHVAGTAAACANNAVGGAGVAWGARVLPIRALDGSGGSIADIAAAIRWAAGLAVAGVPTNPNPAKVINLSLGGEAPPSTTLQNAINEANATGAVIVVAAGNSSVDAAGFTPANQGGVIAVSAVGPSVNGSIARASYSNFGPGVSLVAPGGNQALRGRPADGVLSTLGCLVPVAGSSSYAPTGAPPCADNGAGKPSGFGYAYYQGTSMASPHVAGVVALMMSRQPSLKNAGAGAWTRALAYLSGSVNPVSLADCERGCGAGLLDAAGAVGSAAAYGPVGPLLVVEGGAVDLGTADTSASVTVKNVGDAPATWSLAATGPGLSVEPSLTVPAGESRTFTVSLDRSGLAGGLQAGRVNLKTTTGARRNVEVRVYYAGGTGVADVGELRLRVYRHDGSAAGRTRLESNKPSLVVPYPYAFALPNLPTGTYDLVAYRYKTQPASPSAPVEVSELGELDNLRVEAGRVLGDLTVQLVTGTRTICSENHTACP